MRRKVQRRHEASRRTLALSYTAQVARVTEHVVQGDLRRARELLLPDLTVRNRSAPRVEPSNDRACEFTTISHKHAHLTTKRTLELRRGNDLNCHDGLEDDGVRLVVDLTEGTDDGQAEGQLRRVDRVGETVLQDEPGAAYRVARQCALLQCLVEALYGDNIV